MDQKAKLLLDILAFLDCDGVPVELFKGCSRERRIYNHDPNFAIPEELISTPLEDPELLENAIAILIQASLVKRTEDNAEVRCDPEVQKAVLNAMEPKRRQEIFNRTVYLLNANFPQQRNGANMLENWKECGRYEDQVTWLLSTYDELKAELEQPVLLCEIIRRYTWYLFERGQYRDAERILDETCAILEQASQNNYHPGFGRYYVVWLTSDLYSTRGSIEYETNMEGYGLRWFEETKELRRSVVRPGNSFGDLWLLMSDGNWANALMASDKASEALPLLEGILNFDRQVPNYDLYLTDTCNCYQLLGRYDEAIKACKQSMALVSTAYGPESLRMALDYFNLGSVYLAQNDLDSAFDAISHCLTIRREKMPDHHYMGLTCHKLAVIVRARGDLESAIVLFREALQIIGRCEFQAAAFVRTAFALSAALTVRGEFGEAAKAKAWGEAMRFNIPGVSQGEERPSTEEAYDKLVLFCHR